MDYKFAFLMAVLAVGFIGGFFYNQGRSPDYYSKSLGGARSLGGYTSIGGGSGLGAGGACCSGLTGSTCSYQSDGCGQSQSSCSPGQCAQDDPDCFPITCPGGIAGSVCYDDHNNPHSLC